MTTSVIKIMFQGEIRRFPMAHLLGTSTQGEGSFGKLCTSLRTVLNHSLPGLEGPPGSGSQVFRVQYKDKEDDWVSILSQPEMDLMWNAENDRVTLRVTQFHEPKHNHSAAGVQELRTDPVKLPGSKAAPIEEEGAPTVDKLTLKQQQQQRQKEVKALMQEATELKRNGEAEAAIKLLKEGHEKFPENPRFEEISTKWQAALDEAAKKAQQQQFIKEATEFAKEKLFPQAVHLLQEAHAQFPQHPRIATLLEKWQAQMNKQQTKQPTANNAVHMEVKAKETAPTPVPAGNGATPDGSNKDTTAAELVFQGGETVLLGTDGQFSSKFTVKVPVGAANGTYCLVADSTKKTLRVLKNGKVDQLGGQGPWARFNLTMEPNGCLYAVHHPQTGRYLKAATRTTGNQEEEGNLASNNIVLSSTTDQTFVDVIQQDQQANTVADKQPAAPVNTPTTPAVAARVEGCPTATAPPQPPTVVSTQGSQPDCAYTVGVSKLQEMGFNQYPEAQLVALLTKHDGAVARAVAELIQMV